jgi:VWFA-related protein
MRGLRYGIVLWIAVLGAQQTPEQGVARFTSSTQLVVEMVSVTDKSGKPVEGLTAKDFIVTENGVAQTVSICEYQKLDNTPVAPPVTEAIKAQPGQIAPERPGDIRYRDRRLLVLYFESMPVADAFRSLDAAVKFIRTRMEPADLMAILRHDNGAVKVLNDFTRDRDRLEQTIQKIAADITGFNEDEITGDTGAAFGQDDSEFNLFNTNRQLAALQTASKMLGTLNEKKVLVYFASGLMLSGVDNQAQLAATINAALRANVSFYPVDARGLMALPPIGDASVASPGGLGMYNGSSAMAAISNLQRSQDTLYALAADTGGKALFDYNDLTRGIVQAQQAISSYYIIGYYTTNQALDGKFRRIKIALNPEARPALSAKLDYRQGYFAGKTFDKFTGSDKERQLEEALMLGDPITDLTIAMEVNYFQLNRAEYFVPVSVKIPGSELALARRGGADHTLIDFIGEVKEEYGNTVQNVRDKVDIKFTSETAAELAKHPIEYETGFTLLPGTYTIKLLARDAETGRIGTYLHTFTIPNLNKLTEQVPISSVVLSSQRVDLDDALFNAGKEKQRKAAEAVNPLIEGGQKLIPSVTRVFSKSREMYVYFQAYQQGPATVQPVIAYVTFYRGQAKAFETVPLKAAHAMSDKLNTMPIRFSIPLDKLQPGRYTCQVTVVDPSGERAAFWQAPVMVIP